MHWPPARPSQHLSCVPHLESALFALPSFTQSERAPGGAARAGAGAGSPPELLQQQPQQQLVQQQEQQLMQQHWQSIQQQQQYHQPQYHEQQQQQYQQEQQYQQQQQQAPSPQHLQHLDASVPPQLYADETLAPAPADTRPVPVTMTAEDDGVAALLLCFGASPRIEPPRAAAAPPQVRRFRHRPVLTQT